MALVLGDRVKVRSRTTGTGDFLLENTVDGFQSFDAIGDGNETFYSIVDAAGNWEVGRGTYTALTSTLSRDSILSSSNSSSKVNFPAGSKNVFCTYPASVATTIATGGGLSSDSFKTIQVAGQSDVVADNATDTLILAAGANIDITTDATTDTITITNNLSAVATDIVPAADNTYDLGSPDKQWRHVYTAGGSIYLDNIKLTNVNGKFVATTVVNPGQENEEEDPEDSNATSEIGGGGGVSVNDFGEGFTDALDDGKITTSKLYNKNPDPGLNNQYELGVTNGGVVTLPDGSIINGATLKTVAGNYAGITAGPASPSGRDEDSWVWVDNDGATIATKYSTDNHQWKFDNNGDLNIPPGGTIRNAMTGDDLLGGGSTSYTPDDTDNWDDPAVNTIAAALDELAAKVTALQNFEIDGGNANTPAAGELLIDGNGA